MINLLILFFSFKYFLWDSFTAYIAERKQKMKKIDAADRHAEEILEQAKSEANALVIEAWERKKKILADAESDAVWLREAKILAIEQEIARMKEDARRRLESDKQEFEKNFESLVKQTAFHVLKKLGADRSVQDDYVAHVIRDVEKQL